MIPYILVLAAIILVGGLIYANRKQARVTASFASQEPDVDLTYRPPASPEEEQEDSSSPGPQRDPKLAGLSERDLVMEALKECYDPEIPLNIVDLGLIYEVDALKDAVKVKMSLTAPGCPSSQSITQDIRAKLEDAGFSNPEVEIVWDPPWTPQRISPEGRKSLGI